MRLVGNVFRYLEGDIYEKISVVGMDCNDSDTFVCILTIFNRSSLIFKECSPYFVLGIYMFARSIFHCLGAFKAEETLTELPCSHLQGEPLKAISPPLMAF
ncbi:hypothetical protein HMPREF9103_02009 [Lentilactobacillus parafarraginis F0439]|uniref:Uncharacterized protein n=1 Tax=Lentilactobacillus parafarraginis F0439 TaxID=797515 RepID=G9ZQK2_9LACO|nr:hypothetical protein HMPREF9103_02009 [Lentilactobacillus parafarraginis F0439]